MINPVGQNGRNLSQLATATGFYPPCCAGQPAGPGVCHGAPLRVPGEGHLRREPGRHQAEGPGQVQVSRF